jgi:cytochrome c-type biogenesis protein CcmH/NrfG
LRHNEIPFAAYQQAAALSFLPYWILFTREMVMASMRAIWMLVVLAGCSRMHSDNQLMTEAQQFMAKGETKAAVIQLKNVLQQTPSNGGARLMLGKLYLDSGDVMSAEKELRRALELGANSGDVMPSLGRSLLLQGQ